MFDALLRASKAQSIDAVLSLAAPDAKKLFKEEYFARTPNWVLRRDALEAGQRGLDDPDEVHFYSAPGNGIINMDGLELCREAGRDLVVHSRPAPSQVVGQRLANRVGCSGFLA